MYKCKQQIFKDDSIAVRSSISSYISPSLSVQNHGKYSFNLTSSIEMASNCKKRRNRVQHALRFDHCVSQHTLFVMINISDTLCTFIKEQLIIPTGGSSFHLTDWNSRLDGWPNRVRTMHKGVMVVVLP